MTSKVWDKQHGGNHYQKYKIQPSKFVVENELLISGRLCYKIYNTTPLIKERNKIWIKSNTFYRNDNRKGLWNQIIIYQPTWVCLLVY